MRDLPHITYYRLSDAMLCIYVLSLLGETYSYMNLYTKKGYFFGLSVIHNSAVFHAVSVPNTRQRTRFDGFISDHRLMIVRASKKN